MNRTFKQRLATLEALEAAQGGEQPPVVCMHEVDAAALGDAATPPAIRDQIATAYGLGGQAQKLYVGLCGCAWDNDGRSCRVCADRPVIAEEIVL